MPTTTDATGNTLLDVLTPYEAPFFTMERWGPASDGGYVVPAEVMRQANVLVSGGVSDNVEFEARVAREATDIRIGLFDHTISKAPDHTPSNATWHRLGLGDEPGFISLEEAALLSGAKPDEPVALKLDIESSEWELLATTPATFWERVTVLMIELHGLDRITDWSRYARLLGNLKSHLLLIHLHGNNYARVVHLKREGIEIPIVMEATYINRKLIPSSHRPEVWNHGAPTLIDRPNNPQIIDIAFDFWLDRKKSGVRRFLKRIGLYLLPWRVRKNIRLNFTPKSR